MKPLIVTGTDTGVGKTMVAAMLTLALNGIYWKPVQSGTAGDTDTERVAALTGLDYSHFRPERYVFTQLLSPHRAAELDGITIEPETVCLPGDIPNGRHLIIEGAGGVLVPVTRGLLQAELFVQMGAPVIAVTRTTLGTINHTLLTLEALRNRAIPLLGLIFVGDENADNERTITEMGDVRRLGRLPLLPHPGKASLSEAFAAHFDVRDFEAADER